MLNRPPPRVAVSHRRNCCSRSKILLNKALPSPQIFVEILATRPNAQVQASPDMSCSPARRAALAPRAVLLCRGVRTGAGTSAAELSRATPQDGRLADHPRRGSHRGRPGKGYDGAGQRELAPRDLSIRADSLTYHEGNEDVEAHGDVRLQRNGDTLKGPALRYSIRDATGVFEKPDFTFTPRPKTGQQPFSARGPSRDDRVPG